MSLLVVTILVVSSSYTVLGQLSCDPGIFSQAGAVCRRIEKRDEPCKDLAECLDNCFWRGVRIDDSTSGCTRCGANSNSNSMSNVNVTYMFVPYKFNHFKLFVQLPAVSEVQYELELKLPFERPVCVCTSESFSFIVEYGLIDLGPMELKVKSFSNEIFERRFPIPRHCGDTERGVPYDGNTCGVPQLQPPTNVTMHCNETHTNISWNKYISYLRPDCNSHIFIKSERFYLTVKYSDNTELEFVVFNASSVTLNTTAAMNITLYGYTRCSGLLELRLRKTSATGYSLPVHTSNIGPGTCCGNSTCDATSSIIHPLYTPQPSSSFHPNSNIQPKTVRGLSVRPTTTTTQTSASKSVSRTRSNGVIADVVVVGILISAAGLVILTILLVYSRYCRRGGPVVTDILSTSPSPDLSPPPPSSTLPSETTPSVMVVFSP